MIQCDTCGQSHIERTLFCSECGTALYQIVELGSAGRWNYINFLMRDSGRKQRLPLSELIMIGRADPDTGHWPQLDLSEEGGLERGVSRRHAIIRATTHDPVVIDQNSANGTWIDGLRLEPERPYMLPIAGQMRFGDLDVHIFLE